MEEKQNNRSITLRLYPTAIFQILDGLRERMMTWLATEQYLEQGYSHISDFIEECSNPQEAREIAEFYEQIINSINQQLDMQ